MMKKNLFPLLILFSILIPQKSRSLTLEQYRKKPKLVVVIVIDQFRADYLSRVQARFLPEKKGALLGGFNFLLHNGAWFPHAKYTLLQNMTGPGHATILSGANPYLTGIPVNEWFDPKKQKPVYCVEDEEFGWLSGTTGGGRIGTSPKNFIGTTFGDELKNFDKNSRVVSLSLKDRAAILLGGKRSDATIWMDPLKLTWTSSKYYFPNSTLPTFVTDANLELDKNKNQKVTDSPLYKSFFIPGQTNKSLFPQNMTWGNKGVLNEPAGLVLLENLAEKALDKLELGKDEHTDLLAVSFSSHDYAGHAYGPDSPAMDEMTAAEDAVLSKFFNHIQKSVPGGFKNVAVVLTADHGVAPNPEIAKTKKLGGGRVDESALKNSVESALSAKFGKESEKWVLEINEMNVYLNRSLIAQKKIDEKTIEDAVVHELLKNEAILSAFTHSQYLSATLPEGLHKKDFLNSYYPQRSGDIVAVPKPFYVAGDDTAIHQTDYSYDATIPLIILGENIKAGVYSKAEVIDIAPTLSFLSNVLPPALSEGRILSETIR